MLMLKPIVEQWNNVIALDLFSLHDSSTGVATQWRAASSAFQDMEAMRDERITHESVHQNEHFVRDSLQFWHFPHVIKQVRMSQSATPATQNDGTTCLETFEKDMFSSFHP